LADTWTTVGTLRSPSLRDVFPGDGPHRFILFDHDSTLDGDVIAFLKATGLDPTRTGIQAPWQNGVAEGWVGAAGASSSTTSSRSTNAISTG
jgi:hypothetical protein